MKELEKKITDILVKRHKAKAVYLFGSFAKGNVLPRSDVDIAVLFEEGDIPEEMERISIQQDLSDELGRECDLVVLNSASPIVSMQVIKYGRLISVQNKTLHGKFIIRTIGAYFDLKKVREVIEKNILKGKVYG